MQKFDKDMLGNIFDEIQNSAALAKEEAQSMNDDFVKETISTVNTQNENIETNINDKLAYEAEIKQETSVEDQQVQEENVDLNTLDDSKIDTGIMRQPIHFQTQNDLIDDEKELESLEITQVEKQEITNEITVDAVEDNKVDEEIIVEDSKPIENSVDIEEDNKIENLEKVNESEESKSIETVESKLQEVDSKKELLKVKRKKKNIKKADKKAKEPTHWYTKLCYFVDVCALICFFLAYGPINNLRDWLVTTATSTATHRYFAYVLYSSDHVEKICSSYVIKQTETNTDTSAIVFEEYTPDTIYSSKFEEQVCKKDPNNDLYKIIPIDEEGYTGFITVIYQPQRLSLVVSNKKKGEKISNFAKNSDAIIAINAGPAKWYSDGTLRPYNIVIADGEIVNDSGEVEEIIGMNEDGVLCLLTCTAKEAIAQGIKWSVGFGPNLIVNGVKSEFVGNGGFGIHPRTAIGQRKDGIVLLFTIDGRGGGGSKGISIAKLADLAQRYGCYNAANLDGGGSTTLVENNKVVNNPVSYQFEGERTLYNSLIYK